MKTISSLRNRVFQLGQSDQLLALITLIMASFGLVMVYSSSYIYAEERFNDGIFYFKRHALYILIGFSLLFFIRFLKARILERIATLSFLFFLVLMSLTLVPSLGVKVGGAHRWLSMGGFVFQPVEFLKVAYILFMAKLLSVFPPGPGLRDGFIYYLVPFGMVGSLCLLQPDFGSFALFLFLTVVLFFNGGARLRYLVGASVFVIPALVWVIWSTPYRRARVLTFFDPWSDPYGAGFQIIQSMLAFYRGGVFGVGLGNSKEKLFYLPKAHNDFSLAVVGEELGFIGICLLLFGFLFMIYRGFRIAMHAKNEFQKLVAIGITALIGSQVFISAAINLGLLPTKGMNMPFVSSGGSSLLSVMIAIGILLCISVEDNESFK